MILLICVLEDAHGLAIILYNSKFDCFQKATRCTDSFWDLRPFGLGSKSDGGGFVAASNGLDSPVYCRALRCFPVMNSTSIRCCSRKFFDASLLCCVTKGVRAGSFYVFSLVLYFFSRGVCSFRGLLPWRAIEPTNCEALKHYEVRNCHFLVELWICCEGDSLGSHCTVRVCVTLQYQNASFILDDHCCALCPGVIDWYNCGTILGALECGWGLVSTLWTHSVHYSWKWGPLMLYCNGPTPWQCS